MNRALLSGCLLLLVAPLVHAQMPAEEAVRDPRQLPEPLEELSANIGDLEQAGPFVIVDSQFRKIGSGDQDAIVWTVRTTRPITYRHVELLVGKFRDVRFYKTLQRSRQELLTTLMYYSDRISVGAVDRLHELRQQHGVVPSAGASRVPGGRASRQ